MKLPDNKSRLKYNWNIATHLFLIHKLKENFLYKLFYIDESFTKEITGRYG